MHSEYFFCTPNELFVYPPVHCVYVYMITVLKQINACTIKVIQMFLYPELVTKSARECASLFYGIQ